MDRRDIWQIEVYLLCNFQKKASNKQCQENIKHKDRFTLNFASDSKQNSEGLFGSQVLC